MVKEQRVQEILVIYLLTRQRVGSVKQALTWIVMSAGKVSETSTLRSIAAILPALSTLKLCLQGPGMSLRLLSRWRRGVSILDTTIDADEEIFAARCLF